MRKTREEKAITLIALIITIVVLLILAVVAINAVTGDGIIQHATNARDSYENAQAKEQDVLSYYEQYLSSEGKTGEWLQDKTIVKNVRTGQTIEVGDIVNYVATGSDYIDDENDDSDDNEKWAVLGVENGHVLLVSLINVGDVSLSGAEDYIDNAGINELNSKGAEYDGGTGAVANSGRSINVDDINRITGYNPLKTGNGKIDKEGEYNQYLNKVTYTLKADTNDASVLKVFYSSEITEEVMSAYSEFKCLDETSLGTGESITVETTHYSYCPATLTKFIDDGKIGITSQDKIDTVLFNSTVIESNTYWLASSVVVANAGYVNYGLRSVEDGEISTDRLWRTLDGDATYERGVRAVITLKSDVTLSKVDGVWEISI